MQVRTRFTATLGFAVAMAISPSPLSAQWGRRPPDNPSGNVNSHIRDVRPVLNVPYELVLAATSTGPADTAGIAEAARDGACVEHALRHYFLFTSGSTYVERDSTTEYCAPEDGSDSLVSNLRNVRITGHYSISGMDFRAQPGGLADSLSYSLTGWVAGDTLYIDQECGGGGLAFVRRPRSPRKSLALAPTRARWYQPCG